MKKFRHARRRFLFLPAAILAILIPITSAYAREQWAPTDTELAVLPAYCKDRMKSDYKKGKAKWTTLGEGFLHIHHYCMALNFLNRAKAQYRDKAGRNFNLQNAQNNIQYMFDQTNDKYVLAPDFYITKGEISFMQGEKGEAQTSFEKATRIKPDYPKGWLALSDYFRHTKRDEQARRVLEEGLKAVPKQYQEFMQKKIAELPVEGGPPTTPSNAEKPRAR